MIVDASALLAVVFNEPERADFLRAIAASRERFISAVNYVEAGIRADSAPTHPYARLVDEVILDLSIEIAPVTAEQARIARESYRRFGKGNHPARHNLGDCFAYALATARGEPLLFKGGDFALTDVRSAL